MPGSSQVYFRRCDHSAFNYILICVVFNLVVQVILTIRFVVSPHLLDSTSANGVIIIIITEFMQSR